MRKFQLIIKNFDGSIYWTEGFESKFDLNQWLNTEKTRFYWKKDFQVEITDNSEALKALEDQAKIEIEAYKEKIESAKQALSEVRKTKPKNIAEVAQVLEKILDLLNIA